MHARRREEGGGGRHDWPDFLKSYVADIRSEDESYQVPALALISWQIELRLDAEGSAARLVVDVPDRNAMDKLVCCLKVEVERPAAGREVINSDEVHIRAAVMKPPGRSGSVCSPHLSWGGADLHIAEPASEAKGLRGGAWKLHEVPRRNTPL